MNTIADKAQHALSKAASLGDEADRIFLQLDAERILADAEYLDNRKAAMAGQPLYGKLVSLKDLFDETGQVTSAGSPLLADRLPAEQDAEVVKRLRDAGALVFGRTNMSEFAYSGIGQNPHHGTPGCIFDHKLIPGGSSSGAALSVAHGLCDIAMGTDTGGSVRLPAAINGLYGFKPSAQSIPVTGVHPLSQHYDSVGPLCTTLKDTLLCLNVIRDEPLHLTTTDKPLNLAVPGDTFCADLDQTIAQAFEQQLESLRAEGHSITRVACAELDNWTDAMRLTISYEARTRYQQSLPELEKLADEHVLARMHQSDHMAEADFSDCLQQRQSAIAYFNTQLQGYDALLVPTMKCERPALEQVLQEFTTFNSAVLRNTSYINLVDGCALTIPVEREGLIPTSLMVCGSNGTDERVLAASVAIDSCINNT